MRVRAKVARYLDQTVGVRTVFRTNHQEQVRLGSHFFHSHLPIFGRVTDILCVRALDVGEFLLEGRNDVLGLVETQGRLRQVRHTVRVRYAKRFDLRWGSNDLRDGRGFAQRSDDLVVIAVANEDERITVFGKLDGLDVNFCDQRASRVDNAQFPLLAGLADLGRNPVSAVDYALPCRNFVNAVDKDGALLLEFLDHEAVVDDFLADVDRRPEGLKRDADDIDSANYPGTEPTGFQKQ